jgi:hypothetical protein
MSLNRCEQTFFDYLSQRAEERQYWQEKVRRMFGRDGINHYTVTILERELWAGFVERSAVVPILRQWVQSEGSTRTSMKNLAEHMVRLWAPPIVKKPASAKKRPIEEIP